MYEWLISYQEMQQRIAFLELELERYKSELERWCDPQDLGRYSLVKESKASKLEDIIEDHEYLLAHEMNHCLDLVNLIYDFKGLDQHIMRMKYVEGLTLKEIAGELGYGYTYIKKRHGNILKALELKRGYQKGTAPIEKT